MGVDVPLRAERQVRMGEDVILDIAAEFCG